MFIIAKAGTCLEKMHKGNVGNFVLQKYGPYNILIIFDIRLRCFSANGCYKTSSFNLRIFLLLRRRHELLDKFFSNVFSNMKFLHLLLTGHKFTACMKARHKDELN